MSARIVLWIGAAIAGLIVAKTIVGPARPPPDRAHMVSLIRMTPTHIVIIDQGRVKVFRTPRPVPVKYGWYWARTGTGRGGAR